MGYGQNNQNQERQAFSLLELNNRVKGVVLNAFPETCWVRAEMSDVRTNAASGHCYLEFIEKNAITGQLVAKARGSIWAKTFRMLKPYFEMETGQIFASGLKVLVKVSIEFHELYGYSLTVLDIEKFANAAHAHGVPLIVDNTFATPVNCRPIEWGADIVTHSTTKYMDGHGAAVGGAIVDSGKFDWKKSGKYAPIAEPNPSYHGVSFVDAAGPAAFVTYIRAILLRDTGATISPFNAFLLLQGTETLSLRLDRHIENTKKVVEFLANHPKVEKVNHPSLPDHPDHALYTKYFKNGGASIFTFNIKGGQEEAHKFIDSLQIFSLLANVADVKSLVIHPATTTHSQLTDEELADQGIGRNTIRLSIGTEHIDDIIADLSQAFDKV